jgi:hypothetical protein
VGRYEKFSLAEREEKLLVFFSPRALNSKLVSTSTRFFLLPISQAFFVLVVVFCHNDILSYYERARIGREFVAAAPVSE